MDKTKLMSGLYISFMLALFVIVIESDQSLIDTYKTGRMRVVETRLIEPLSHFSLNSSPLFHNPSDTNYEEDPTHSRLCKKMEDGTSECSFGEMKSLDYIQSIAWCVFDEVSHLVVGAISIEFVKRIISLLPLGLASPEAVTLHPLTALLGIFHVIAVDILWICTLYVFSVGDGYSRPLGLSMWAILALLHYCIKRGQ